MEFSAVVALETMKATPSTYAILEAVDLTASQPAPAYSKKE